MSRFKAAKTLDAIDARIHALEAERRALEQQALGGEIAEGAARRERYFAIGDSALRRRLINLERDLHEKRREQGAATVAYWDTVAAETRRKLDDLREQSLRSSWRRGVWYDILTILWILVGGGFWAFRWAGAIAGAVITAAWAPFLVRGRERTRISSIRKGEDILRSAENELRIAERERDRHQADGIFSATEAVAGAPDAG